ncbi:predicted protein [Thalassiosira pseudonana CCMP1335]|uniref:Glutaredoxin domain-containing protein n=1 Tax=Thalassiosira pseudonana TaxID=35128 RepID=B8BTU3_THAPS|nr:predicted protein [Thalassiosira pseudonana CCMP1335]EED95159.1 predicted protein [Thalassiosira pseudonana CCMP1335]
MESPITSYGSDVYSPPVTAPISIDDNDVLIEEITSALPPTLSISNYIENEVPPQLPPTTTQVSCQVASVAPVATPVPPLPIVKDCNDPSDFITSAIASNDVLIFSTTYCTHCQQTKQLLTRMNVTPTVIELDRMKNGLGAGEDSIALKLLHLYGQSTVPNVFIKGQHIGTNDDVQAKARSGELQKLLMG